MKDVVVVGAGKIGAMIVDFLGRTGDYRIIVVDHDPAHLERLAGSPAAERIALDVADSAALAKALAGRWAVISAMPYRFTWNVAQAARAAGVHYLDLTEDVATTRLVKGLSDGAASAFIPQCGLAPGFITIVTNDLIGRFDSLQDVRMRVGALPEYPSNALSYNLTWSTDGVINEYCEPCEAIVNGVLRETAPLEECEEFALDGVRYEAFNTSGGLGTLCESLDGRVRNLNYRTIRYPGHATVMKALLHDLNMRNRRDVLKDILEHALPSTLQDVVIVFATVSGWRDGRRLVQETYARKTYAQPVGGVMRSAIQVTTAAGVCGVLDLLAEGRLPQSGFVRQEDVRLEDFLANRFGRYFGEPPAQARSA
jgi:saccharopine dehydrogenase-like NADP-dependent oxidoreductase